MIFKLATRTVLFLAIFMGAEAQSVLNHDWIQRYEKYFSKSYTPAVVQRLVGLFNHMYLFMEDNSYTWVDFCEQIKEFADNTPLDCETKDTISTLAAVLAECEDAQSIKKSLWSVIDLKRMHSDEPIMMVLRSSVLEKFISVAERKIFASLSPERRKEIEQQREREQKAQEAVEDDSLFFKSIATGTVLGMSYSLYKRCCR